MNFFMGDPTFQLFEETNSSSHKPRDLTVKTLKCGNYCKIKDNQNNEYHYF
ncbi:hypothetical protein LEP1GSC088_0385 [Leptospira interrogans str. L1207]|nr:hypothetical protein LEP1GSC088_0385 [Leptospira interrogans str. L1207]